MDSFSEYEPGNQAWEQLNLMEQGITDTNVTKEASDMVLVDDNFARPLQNIVSADGIEKRTGTRRRRTG